WPVASLTTASPTRESVVIRDQARNGRESSLYWTSSWYGGSASTRSTSELRSAMDSELPVTTRTSTFEDRAGLPFVFASVSTISRFLVSEDIHFAARSS